MKRAMTLSSALATWMLAATTVLAQNSLQQPQMVAPSELPAPSGLSQTSFEDEAAAPAEEPKEDAAAADSSSGCGCEEAACGCEEASCGCEPSCGCDGGCGCDSGCCLFGDCCLGDRLHAARHLIALAASHNFGGWIAARLLQRQDRPVGRSGRPVATSTTARIT